MVNEGSTAYYFALKWCFKICFSQFIAWKYKTSDRLHKLYEQAVKMIYSNYSI